MRWMTVSGLGLAMLLALSYGGGQAVRDGAGNVASAAGSPSVIASSGSGTYGGSGSTSGSGESLQAARTSPDGSGRKPSPNGLILPASAASGSGGASMQAASLADSGAAGSGSSGADSQGMNSAGTGEDPANLPVVEQLGYNDAKAAEAAAPGSEDESFKHTVDAWVKELSGQPGFETWRQAQWTSSPLGAGQHGWVILLTKGSQEVGYLVVTYDPHDASRYQLSEYGYGAYPLFSMNTLNKALRKEGMVPAGSSPQTLAGQAGLSLTSVYLSPFYAYWEVRGPKGTAYFDAKTGERYPMNHVPAVSQSELPADSVSAGARLDHIDHALQSEVFNPWDRLNWVDGPKADFRSLQDVLNSLKNRDQITVTAAIFHGQVTTLFAVTGYHQWNAGEPYLALDQEGPRYIPYSQVASSAAFYQWKRGSAS